MILSLSPGILVGRQGGEPVAQITWDVVEDGWYINFLFCEEPHQLLPLLSRFRRIWREAGEPHLTADIMSDNTEMCRLAAVINSSPHNNPKLEILNGQN